MSTNYELRRIKDNIEWIRRHVVNHYPISSGDFQILQRFLANPSSKIDTHHLRRHIEPYSQKDGVKISPEAHDLVLKILENQQDN
jgi:hypothetical protein